METSMLQLRSKIYQYALKKLNSLSNTMQDTPNLDEATPLKSFVFYRKFKAAHFCDKLKKVRNGPFNIIIKPTEVTYELLMQDRKTFHTN